MADNSVFISGAATGAFTEALSDLPPWATEATAGQIEMYLRKSFDIQKKSLAELVKGAGGKSGKQLSPEDIKKANDGLREYAKQLKRANDEGEKAAKRAKQKKKQEDDELLWGKKLGTKNEKMAYAFSGLAVAGKKLESVFQQSFVTSDALLSSGIDVTAGMNGVTDAGIALQHAVILTSLRLETLQKVAEKYSSAINATGFNKFAKTVSMTSAKLQEFGYSNEQQAELIGALMESESNYSDVRKKSAEEFAQDAVKLGSQLTKLSFATGKSVESMTANIVAQSKSTDSMLVSSMWGDKAAKNMNTFVASFGDNTVAKELMQKLAATQNPILTKAYQDMVKAGEGSLADQMTRIAQRARDTGDAIGAQKELADLALSVDRSRIQALEIQASAGNEGARATLDTLNAARQAAQHLSETASDTATANKATRAGLKTQVESAKATPDKTFALLNDQINIMTSGVKLFNDAVDGLNKAINPAITSWAGMAVVAAGAVASVLMWGKGITTFLSLFGKGGSIVSEAFTGIARTVGGLLNPIAKLTAAFAAGYGIGTAIYAMISDFKWFTTLMDTIFSGLDHIIQYIPGIGGDAKERIASRDKASQASRSAMQTDISKAAGSEISVPKTPAVSTINSPSAVAADPSKTSATNAPTTAPEAKKASGSGIEAPGKNSDINSLLGYQASIMEQLLQATKSVLSVNQDILRYSRNHT